MLNQKTADTYEQRRALAREISLTAGLQDPFSTHHVWLDLPPDPPIGGADSTYVRTPGGSLRKMSDLFPFDYWSTLYIDQKWRGHVFCPSEYQQAVYGAAKTVFKEKYGLEFEKSAGEMSHVPAP